MDRGFFAGQMLIAMPGIGDPRFERALIVVCTHDDEHAVGLVVNRPIEGITVPDLLEKLDIHCEIKAPPDLVMLGGPVERERGFVLHTDDYEAELSIEVGAGMRLTATRDILETLARASPHPRHALLALGYAGWGAGQLEDEIKENVWLTCDADEALVFDPDHGTKWARALAKIGVDAQRLTFTAGRA